MPKERLNRAAVVRAAAELIDGDQGSDITLADLAAQLGVRTPSLYNHISGVDDLQVGIALFGTEELSKRIARAAIGRSGDAALWAIASAYREFAKERPGLYQATLRAPASTESSRLVASNDIIDVLKVVLESHGYSDERAIHVIRGLRSLMHGFVSLELVGGFGIPLDVDESYHDLIATFVAGLRQESRL